MHSASCPLLGPIGPLSEQKISDWYQGYNLGYNDSRDEDDNYVFPWQVYNYESPAYRLGYDIGRDECEEEVERAVESNYGMEIDHGDPDEIIFE